MGLDVVLLIVSCFENSIFVLSENCYSLKIVCVFFFMFFMFFQNKKQFSKIGKKKKTVTKEAQNF